MKLLAGLMLAASAIAAGCSTAGAGAQGVAADLNPNGYSYALSIAGPIVPTGVEQHQHGDVKTERGVIDGATYRIDVPANWNKGVVISNHGYDANTTPRQPPAIATAPSARLRVYLDRGFAVAQSSYSRGGWALEQAMADNTKMISYFESKHGKIETLIASGGAMGASITMMSIEAQPELYDAGLVTCCSGLAPHLEAMNNNFELMVLFDYYFPGVMPPPVGPLNGYTNSQEMTRKVQAALDANPEKAEIFRRLWGRQKEHVASSFTFQSYIIHEAQERSGGLPFSNDTTIYNVDDDIQKVNEGVKRYKADKGANEYLKKWFTSTGKLQRPLFIMSPIYDPTVPVQNTEAYVDIVRRAGYDDMMVFQTYDHFGHGSTTTPEVANAFDALLAWMKGGPKPPSGRGITINEQRPARGAAAPTGGGQ
ncbi:MAG TPA: DUF6351 family protein [Hyphomonadaceae bacterium]